MVTDSSRTRRKNRTPTKASAHGEQVPPLYNGDHLTQPEFHRRYEACPEHVKAELIGGIVYMASPLRRPHAAHHPRLSGVFLLYEAATPGIETLDNATTILDDRSEPQPDLALRILPEWGGQSWTDENEYVHGSPELLGEIAHSSVALDLHDKRLEYQRAGALEYLVWCVKEAQLHWFNFKSRRQIKPDRQGIYRSLVFPGLWVDSRALAERDLARLIEVIQQGIASAEHAAFVTRLEAARRKKK